jgi:methylenetetrahydrofolate reductase (NADPH)
VGDFEISVAAYPEGHPAAPNPRFELEYLKRKIDAGASRAITQFFFDNDAYLRFVDRAEAAGITVPIVPGILPITNYARTAEFAERCGAHVPAWLKRLFADLDDDPQTRALVAASVAAEQCCSLLRHGVDQFHFYTLNRADLSDAVCRLVAARTDDMAAVA